MPRPGRFFVASLLPECEDEDLSRYFGKFGRVAQATVVREKDTLLSKCCAHVWMSDASVVSKILEDEHKIWEHEVKVKRHNDDDDGPSGDARGSSLGKDHSRVEDSGRGPEPDEEPGWFFAGRLSPDSGEDDVKTFFTKFGEVEKVVLLKDKEGVSRKCAFVKMVDAAVVDTILKDEQGHEMEGKKIAVRPYTKPRDGHPDGPRKRGKGGKDRDAGCKGDFGKGGYGKGGGYSWGKGYDGYGCGYGPVGGYPPGPPMHDKGYGGDGYGHYGDGYYGEKGKGGKCGKGKGPPDGYWPPAPSSSGSGLAPPDWLRQPMRPPRDGYGSRPSYVGSKGGGYGYGGDGDDGHKGYGRDGGKPSHKGKGGKGHGGRARSHPYGKGGGDGDGAYGDGPGGK